MSKHTPGPWQVSAGAVDNPRLIVENDLALPICAMSLRGVHGDTRRMEANARLIAAAPELLEALEMAEDRIESERRSGEFDPLLRDIRAVISKATGGQS